LRIVIDTNVLAYAEGINGAARKKAALDIIEHLPTDSTFVPVQVLGELFHALVRKGERSPKRALAAILSWQDVFPTVETSPAILTSAAELAARHNLSIWDAVVFSAAAATGCRLLLSEDLQAGFTWTGVTVVNPFQDPKHELLAGIIAG
jgi:predicted nucleic acid-binding protein